MTQISLFLPLEIKEWTDRQINKATGFLRQISISASNALSNNNEEVEVANTNNATIVQSSDNYFFEQISDQAFVHFRNITSVSNASPYLSTDTSANALYPSFSKNSSVATNCSNCDTEALSQNTTFNLDNEQQLLSQMTVKDDSNVYDLYVEALYTIFHKVGKSSLPMPETQLVQYVKSAFQINDQTHNKLMNRARKEKPPIVILNVNLIEARNIIAKDINGFSDPYAMLGVIPAKQKISKNSLHLKNKNVESDRNLIKSSVEVGADEEVVTTNKCSPPTSPPVHSKEHSSGGNMLQRFGGSFRRKLHGNNNNRSDSKYDSKKIKNEFQKIPARLIKASSVQYKTLNPKWNEKFQFYVEDFLSDEFHLDIWDHDDQAQSVLDAVTSLNQISGLKGLGRYFKEVTQSARAGSNDLVDDFLGSVTVKLKDIPSTGLEDWFILEKRSEKSEVSGQVLLKLWLSTKEERISKKILENEATNIMEPEDHIDVRQHIELVQQFALHTIRSSNMSISSFQGIHSEAATTILHQHAIQGDLTELHQAMCDWLAYCNMLKIGISYVFLFDILTNLISKWQPLALDKEEEDMLAESFKFFDEHCRLLIFEHQTFSANSKVSVNSKFLSQSYSDIRKSSIKSVPLPTNSTMIKRNDVDSFSNMIRCLKLLRESPIYFKCIPFYKNFVEDITDILKQSATIYFQSFCKESETGSENVCEELYQILCGLNQILKKILIFDLIFKTFAEVDYETTVYSCFDNLLYEYITSEVMSEKQIHLKNMFSNVSENEKSLICVLKIHCAMNEFLSYQKPKTKHKMDKINWATTFDNTILNWFDLARVKAFKRVDLACQLDAQIQISSTNEIRHTSSYVDICHIIKQLIWVWEHIQVKNLNTSVELAEKLVQIICNLAEYYVDRIMAQLAADGFCGVLQSFLPPALINIFCAAINNSEQVRRALLLSEKLRLDELSEQYEKKYNKEAQWRVTIDKELQNCEKHIATQIEQSAEKLVNRQTTQFKKHVFHLAWSPAACAVEQSLKPLTDMLDSELSLVHRTLLHKNFLCVMQCQVTLLLQLLQECVDENSGLEPSFYQRLSEAWAIIIDFFHAHGKGISLEFFEAIPAHVKLTSQLALNQMTTIKLIELYYKELLKEQNEAYECKYGILNLRAYYNNNSQSLFIDVIGAKQILPLDSNGLSDPFVIIELVPRLRYPSQPIAKTKIVSKSLNPIFDETFEFQIPPNFEPGAMVHFVVMDHDFLRCNDFAGEALLDLADIPGFGQSGNSNTLRQFNLILIYPARNTKESISVLASRKDDKNAQEFIKSLNISY